MDGVQLPQGYSHFEEAVYFLPFSSQKFLVLNLGIDENHMKLFCGKNNLKILSKHPTCY